MTAKWESMGVGTRWAPTADGPWESYIDNTNPANPPYVFARVGGNAAVGQHAGKVVRGFRFKGQIDSPGLSQSVFEALRGIVPQPFPNMLYPGKTILDAVQGSGNRYAFDWQVAASLLPIGFLPVDTDWYRIESPDYGGVRTAQSVQLQRNAAGGGRIYRVTPADVQILVSDRPTFRVTVEKPNTYVGEVSVITVALSYPGFEFEPIPGVAISVAAAVGTGVANTGSTAFGGRAVASTDEMGVARFLMKGLAGADASNLIIDITDEGVTHNLQGKVGLITDGNTNAPFTTSANFLRSVFSPSLPVSQPITVNSDPAAPKPGQCVTYPEIPDTLPVPSTVKVEDDYGWNAGANSIGDQPGDCELVFNEMEAGPIGAVIGLIRSREAPVSDHTRITHGFYFSRAPGGVKLFQIMENGKAVTEPEGYGGSEEFKIQRAGGAVIYYLGGFFYRASSLPSTGLAIIGCSLYASSDSLPSETNARDCFWQDLLGAAQVCGGSAPSELEPNRVYNASGNNGVLEVNYLLDEDFENPMPLRVMDYWQADGGIFKKSGQWNIRSNVGSYFPRAETDYAEVQVVLYRVPRAMSYEDAFGIPGIPKEYVAAFNATTPMAFMSDNGGVPSYFEGPIVSGMVDPDPNYLYVAEVTVDIYNQSGELVEGGNYADCPVFDIAAEVGDNPEVSASLHVVPVGYDEYDVTLSSYCAYFIYSTETFDGLMYVGGTWKGQMADFICNEFTASIGGQPNISIYGACS